MKPLTKKQKQKADRIIKLAKELSEDGVTTMLASTPDWSLCFARDYIHSYINSDAHLSKIGNDPNLYWPSTIGVKFGGFAL